MDGTKFELTLVGNGVQVIKYDLFQLLVYLLLLPQDNVTFFLYRRRFELRILQDITDDVYRNWNVFAETFRIINRLFAGCVRVQMSTQVLDLNFQFMLASSASPFKCHMLQKVGCPVRVVGFSTGSGINPNPNCSGMSMWLRLCRDRQAI